MLCVITCGATAPGGAIDARGTYRQHISDASASAGLYESNRYLIAETLTTSRGVVSFAAPSNRSRVSLVVVFECAYVLAPFEPVDVHQRGY